MRKKDKLKKVLMFLFAMVMFLSPVFLAGCSSESSSGGSSSGGSSSGGSSSGSGDSSGSATTPTDETNLISSDEYGEYFDNYRITYYPDDSTDKTDFYNILKEQNESIANLILSGLYEEYGNDSKALFSSDSFLGENESTKIQYITDVTFGGTEKSPANCYYDTSIADDSGYAYKEYFSHKDAMSLLDDTDKWNWDNSAGVWTNDNGKTFSKKFVQKIKLASLMIACGYDLNDSESKDYETYTTYAQIINGLSDDALVQSQVFDVFMKKIDHSGFTTGEIEMLKNFVLNEIIGTNIVANDNKRFVNVYVDSNGNITEIDDDIKAKYNRFLTDETFASVYQNGDGTFAFNTFKYFSGNSTPANADKIYSIGGMSYYAQKYLSIGSSQQNFSFNNIDLQCDDTDDNTTNGYENISEYCFNQLIDLDGDGKFNANVCGYDEGGNANSKNAGSVVTAQIDGETKTLFSIRKQYFKNYYNTVDTIINKIFSSKTSTQENYPYDTNYPTVPLCISEDTNLIQYQTTGVSSIPSASYQEMILMPKQDVKISYGAIFFSLDFEASFTINSYLRYYDGESGTYAHWDDDSKNIFYSLGSSKMQFIDSNTASGYLTINFNTILTNAKINDDLKGNILLNKFENPFSDNLTKKFLITKNNYGQYYNYVELPDGNKVVCFDGTRLERKKESSYVEIIFSTSNSNNFKLCFYPNQLYIA